MNTGKEMKPEKNPSNKPTNDVLQARVREVVTIIIKGGTRRNILEYATESKWGLKERAIDAYIARAKEEIAKGISNVKLSEELSIILERMGELYQKSLLINDFKTCLAIQKEAAALMGLYKIKIEVTGEDGKPIRHQAVPQYDLSKLTDEEVMVLEQITAKLQKSDDDDAKPAIP